MIELPILESCEGCGGLCCKGQESPPGYVAIMANPEYGFHQEDVERVKKLPGKDVKTGEGAMKTIQERVDAGVKCLDEFHPDWRGKIDLSRLSMSSCYRCVLGQLFDRYSTGVVELARGERFAGSHGFTVWYGTDTWADLQTEWEKRIREPN
jgi:hypothetical protein